MFKLLTLTRNSRLHVESVNHSPNRVLNRSTDGNVSVRENNMVKELLSPSEGVPFHAAPGNRSYPGPTYGQPTAQGDPYGLPSSLSASPNHQGQQGQEYGFSNNNNNPARYNNASSSSFNPLQNQPRPTPQEQQRPIKKLDETYESQMMLGRQNNTTNSNSNRNAFGSTGQGMIQLGTGGLNLMNDNNPPLPMLQQQPTYVGGVSQFPDQQRAPPSSLLTNNNPFPPYMPQGQLQQGQFGARSGYVPLYQTDYNKSNPPVNPQPMHYNSLAINNPQNPNNWMGHLHLVVQSPPGGGLQDFKIDQETAKSLGATDFNGLVKSKVRELSESISSLRKFDPNVIPSRPMADAVQEILYSSSPSAANMSGSNRSPLDMLADLNKRSIKKLDQLDADNDLDGPPINLADGATVGLKRHPGEPFVGEEQGSGRTVGSAGVNPISNKPPPLNVPNMASGTGKRTAVGVDGATGGGDEQSPNSVSEAVIFEGLAEAMLEQEQSTIALLTLVTTELKGLFDKLMAAALAQDAINSMNANAGMPNGPQGVGVSGSVFGGGDEEDALEMALGLRSIVGFILSDNIERLKTICKSTLLVSMQADSMAHMQSKTQAQDGGASGAPGMPANPNLPGAPSGQPAPIPVLSPSKAVHDTIVRVTTQLESLFAFVTRNNNPDNQAQGQLSSMNPYQANLSPEEVNQVIIHVLSDVVLTLNNILQQTAKVMRDIEKITTAVDNNPQSLASPTGGFTGASLKSFMRGERGTEKMNVSANQSLLDSLEKSGKGGKGGKGGKPDPMQLKLEAELEELRAFKLEQERINAEHAFGAHGDGGSGSGHNAAFKRQSSNTVADELAQFEQDHAPATPKGGSKSSIASPAGSAAGSPRSSALLSSKSPKHGDLRKVMSPREQKSRMLGVLRMIEDKTLRIVNSAFKHWLKVCIEGALREERAANKAATVKRVIRLFGVRSLRGVASAFRKWHEVTLISRSSDRGGGSGGSSRETAELKMKLLDATNRLYEITSKDDRAAAYLAEKSFNRELSLINMELRRNIQELNLQLVELMPPNARNAASSAAGPSATQQQRTSIVQDVLVQREDEIAKCRRDYHELLEQLKQYESFYKVDQNKLKTQRAAAGNARPFKSYGSNSNNGRGRSGYNSGGGGASSDRSRSRSRGASHSRSRSPQHQSRYSEDDGDDSDNKNNTKKYKNHGRMGYLVTSKAKGNALKDMQYVCEKMSVKVARQVLVLEMKRLSEQLKAINSESKQLKSTVSFCCFCCICFL